MAKTKRFHPDEAAALRTAPEPTAELKARPADVPPVFVFIHGLHLLVSVDTFNNVGRKALTEFAMRVVFQMSANDSACLIESPKASNLGLHRALFYNEHEGTLETFRPYATPDAGWLAEAGASRSASAPGN